MTFPYRTGFEHGISLADFASISSTPVFEGVTADNPASGLYAYRVQVSFTQQWQSTKISLGNRANASTSKVSAIWTLGVNDLSKIYTNGIAGFIGSEASSTAGGIGARVKSNGAIQVFIGSGPNGTGTIKGSLPPGTLSGTGPWTFELLASIGNSTGAYDLAINGAVVLSDTNLDTFGGGGTPNTETYIQFAGHGANANPNLIFDLDDIVGGIDETVLLTTTQGKPVHEALVPTSDIEADGTPSTGVNHWELLDERPPGAGDYVELGTAGDRERYGFSNRVETGDVLGVMLWSTASDPLAADTIRTLINSAATEVESGDLVLSATPGTAYSQNQETDPATGVAWTTAGVNAVTAGARRPV